MCVIGYAPPGVDILDETIKKMFEHNHDGAGIMWKPLDGGDIQIRKGFMKVEDLLTAWAEVPAECEKAIHCRIATSGKVSAECCHPFPVRPYTAQMKQATDHAPIVLMHNGVFSFCTPKGGMQCDYSDTMKFAADYIYPLRDSLNNEVVQDLLERISTSRLLILRTNGEAIRLGDWEEKDGVYFSNLNHEPRVSTFTSSYSYSKADDTYSLNGREYTSYGYNYGDWKWHSKITGNTYTTYHDMKADEDKYWAMKEAEDTVSKEDELSVEYDAQSASDNEDMYEYEVCVDVADYVAELSDEFNNQYIDIPEDEVDFCIESQMKYIAEEIEYGLGCEFDVACDESPNVALFLNGTPIVDLHDQMATIYVLSTTKYRTKTVKRFFDKVLNVATVRRLGEDETIVDQSATDTQKVA